MDPETITATTNQDKYGITSQINVFSNINENGTYGNNFTHFKTDNKLGSMVLNTLGLTEASDIDKLLKPHNASKVYVRIDGDRCSVWIPGTDSTGNKGGGSGKESLAIGVY